MKFSALCCHVFALSVLTAAESTANCSAQEETSCLPPDCRWDSSICTEVCFKTRESWVQNNGDKDIRGAETEEPDADSCQERCKAVEDCQHFSYWPHLLECRLQDGNSSVREPEDTEAVSGDRDCGEWCFEVGQWHLGATTNDGWMMNEPQTTEDSSFACQQRCRNTTSCTNFAWWYIDGGCWLLDTTSVNLVVVADQAKNAIVSGPVSCEAPPTPAPTPAPTPNATDAPDEPVESSTSLLPTPGPAPVQPPAP